MYGMVDYHQIGTNKHILKPDHYQPCLNILCAKYNNYTQACITLVNFSCLGTGKQ